MGAGGALQPFALSGLRWRALGLLALYRQAGFNDTGRRRARQPILLSRSWSWSASCRNNELSNLFRSAGRPFFGRVTMLPNSAWCPTLRGGAAHLLQRGKTQTFGACISIGRCGPGQAYRPRRRGSAVARDQLCQLLRNRNARGRMMHLFVLALAFFFSAAAPPGCRRAATREALSNRYAREDLDGDQCRQRRGLPAGLRELGYVEGEASPSSTDRQTVVTSDFRASRLSSLGSRWTCS